MSFVKGRKMNKTKFWLILVAIILSFASIAWDVYDIVMYFISEPQKRVATFYLVYYFIEIFALIAVAVLLSLSIWNKGKHFRARYKYYMTALVLSIIISLFSAISILLIISMFVSDWVWENPEKRASEVKVVNIADTKEEKIAKLRRKRENGEISEEEFNEEMMKLL